MIAIPAIDLMDGKCVRLLHGAFDTSKIYADDPLEMARAMEAAGVEHLHLVDLDGARQGKPMHLGVLEKICTSTSIKVDYGGGLRQPDSMVWALEAGASQVNVGTGLVTSPDGAAAWTQKAAPGQIIAAVDVRQGMVQVAGWTKETSLDVVSFIQKLLDQGIQDVCVTDIGSDGTLQGPAFGLYGKLRAAFPKIFLRASGGVASLDDLKALRKAGMDAAVVGKAMYEGRITMKSLAEFSKT
jgi:phosphoribosylformimino-5-aminoimidazole carboxamide ribotide isomerase